METPQSIIDKMVQLNILHRTGIMEDGREQYYATNDFIDYMESIINTLSEHPEFIKPELMRKLVENTARASLQRNRLLTSITVREFFKRSGESIDGPWYNEIVDILVHTSRNTRFSEEWK